MTYKHRKIEPKQIKANLEYLAMCGKGELIKKLVASLVKISEQNDVTPDWFAYDEKSYEFYDHTEIVQIINNKLKQMAATRHETDNVYYIIKDGKLGLFCKEKTEYSKEVENKAGKVQHYEFFRSIDGMIRKVFIYIKDIPNDKGVNVPVEFLCIYVQDKNEKGKLFDQVIETSFKGSYAQDFLLRLPNVDPTEKVSLSPYYVKDAKKTQEKGKDVFNIGISVKQDGVKIERFHTKEEPNGLPEMIKKEPSGGGVVTWDTFDRDEFLRKLVLEKNKIFEDAIADSKAKDFTEKLAPAVEATKEKVAENSADDDLPF